MDEVMAASLLGGEPRSFTINGRRIDDALVAGLGTDWIELQWPDKRPGLQDTEGPRSVRKERFRLAGVEVEVPPASPGTLI
jgi:hypothetical protein